MAASTTSFLLAFGISLIAVRATYDPTHIKGSVTGDFEYLGSLCFAAGYSCSLFLLLVAKVISCTFVVGVSTTIDVVFKAGPSGGIGQNLIVFTQNSINEVFSAADNGTPKCVKVALSYFYFCTLSIVLVSGLVNLARIQLCQLCVDLQHAL